MKRLKVMNLLAVAVASLALAACSDTPSPTSPSATSASIVASTPAPASSLVVGFTETAVRWTNKPSTVLSVSGVIGNSGGSLAIPGANFTITFPSGAVSQPTSITVSTIPGDYVVYDMLPHGITFNRSVQVRQGLSNTQASGGVLGILPGGHLFGTYTSSDAVPAADGTFLATEILNSQTIWSLISGLLAPDYQTWQINHFSRYMLASG